MNETKYPDTLPDSDCTDIPSAEGRLDSLTQDDDSNQDHLIKSESNAEIRELERAYENFFNCTPAQQIWVLRNCPEKLFLKSDNPINIRKLARQWQTELERMYALEFSVHRIFAGTNPKVMK